MKERDEETFRVVNLNLSAAERDGEMEAEFRKGRLIVAGADDEEVSAAPS